MLRSRDVSSVQCPPEGVGGVRCGRAGWRGWEGDTHWGLAVGI